MSALRVLGLMMVSSWLVVGCSSAKKIEPGAACLFNTDCTNPLVCSMDKCHDACHGTADCPLGQSCVKTAGGNVCQLPAEADCSQTTCGGAFRCASDLRCRVVCQSAATDCTGSQQCVSGVCADPTDLNSSGQLPQKTTVGAVCILHTDCNQPLVCTMDKCHAACNGTADCPLGQSCVKTAEGNVCQLPAEADCSQTTCGGAFLCASDLRCRVVCQSAAKDCTGSQQCVSGVCADPTDLNSSGQLPQKTTAGGVGAVCILHTDCTNPLVCTMGKCHDACHGTADCPAGQSCVRTAQGTVCQLPAEVGCSETTCGGTLVCASDLRCRVVCLSAVDCAGGQVCASGVCADPVDLDVNGQLPQRGPGPAADAGTNLRPPDAATKDSGVDLVVAPADTGAKDGGADATGPGPDVLADVAPTKLPDAGADLVAQPDLPAADLAADKLPSTTPDVNASTPDAVIRQDGGASPVATGCGVTPVATRYFCDDFESGISKWIVSGQDWDTTASMARSGANSITDTPNGDIVAGENAAITMATSVDLTSAVAPVLVFWDKRAASLNNTYIEASSDGGTTWSGLASSGGGDHSTWLLEQISIATFVGKKVRIRFRLAQFYSYPGNGWYIDDVEIRELPAADTARVGATGCSTMPAAKTTRYFCDDFESGLSKWIVSGQDWNTTFSNARSGTHSIKDNPDGSIAPDENAAITLALPMDLTTALSPVLVFWDKRAASLNQTYIEASSDGGTTWSGLADWGGGDHSTWLLEQISLATFVGKNIMIRFRLGQFYSYPGDGWYIDDVEIREAD